MNHLMKKDPVNNQYTPTQELTIKIPSRLAKRVKAYAKDVDNSIEGVVIEALDVFLREWKKRNG